MEFWDDQDLTRAILHPHCNAGRSISWSGMLPFDGTIHSNPPESGDTETV